MFTACGGGGGGGGGASASAMPGVIQLLETSFDATEGTVVNIRVARTGGSSGVASVDYATSAGTANDASDYTEASGTLTWADGVSGNQTISIPITEDEVLEPLESFTVNLSNISAATLGTNSSATVNIVNVLSAGPLNCTDGFAGEFQCSGVALRKRVAYERMGKTRSLEIVDSADIWGWVDAQSGKEYALVALTDVTGIAFVDVTNPEDPVVVGNLRAATEAESGERDIKVYQDHAYVVAGSFGHGMEVFDLTRLRDAMAPETFEPDLVYEEFGEAKNIVINRETGFAYVTLPFGGGGAGCEKGLHMIDIRSPNNPLFAGCHTPESVPLDGQCVVYAGPDGEHVGREICVTTNVAVLEVVDVTEKGSPIVLSRTGNAQVEQFNQGWLTEDHRFYVASDYQDEARRGLPTRTHVFDVSNLDIPVYLYSHEAETAARDHNLFIKGNRVFQANYSAGLRILEFGDLASQELLEVAYFDTAPDDDTNASGVGAGSVYPFFPSGNLVVNDQNGLFVFSLVE